MVVSWHVFVLVLLFLGILFVKWEWYSATIANPMIPILSLSQNRKIALDIAKAIAPHNFSVNGIFAMDPYSSRDLALTLRVLELRPRAVIMGRGYTEEEAEQARTVIKEYMNETGVSDGTLIKISQKVFDEVGSGGIASWVQKQLEAHFTK